MSVGAFVATAGASNPSGWLGICARVVHVHVFSSSSRAYGVCCTEVYGTVVGGVDIDASRVDGNARAVNTRGTRRMTYHACHVARGIVMNFSTRRLFGLCSPMPFRRDTVSTYRRP